MQASGDPLRLTSVLSCSLLFQQVDRKRASDGATPLLAAAENGHLAVVKTLIAAGANIEAKGNDEYWTPLLAAESMGHRAIVDALRASGAVLNPNDEAQKVDTPK